MRVAAIVTGRRTAWIVLLACLLALGLALTLVPRASAQVQANPATAGDSQRVAQWLVHVPSADTTSGIVVWRASGGQALTDAERTAVDARAAAVRAMSPQPTVAWTQLSPDRTTVLEVVPMPTPAVLRDASGVAGRIIRAARSGLPAGIQVQLTGPLATLADNVRASEGSANRTLGIWLLILAAVLLILATRSVVLWLVPLALGGAAATLAYLVGADVSTAVGLSFGGSASALVFAAILGVATAYSLVYALALRAALARGAERHTAAAEALRSRGPGIAGSGLVLLVGALVLVFAADSRARALGLSLAIGIAIATLTVLVAVAAGLALLGGTSLWLGLGRRDNAVVSTTRFGDRRTILASFVTAVIVGALMSGVVILAPQGAPAADAQSLQAREAIDRAFTPGYEDESVMIVPNSLAGDTSILAPTTLAMNLPHAHAVTVGDSYRGFSALTAQFDIDPGSQQALNTIRKLRELIASKGNPTATTLVGGPDAIAIDQADASAIDLGAVVPISVVLMLALLFVGDLRERRLRRGPNPS